MKKSSHHRMRPQRKSIRQRTLQLERFRTNCYKENLNWQTHLQKVLQPGEIHESETENTNSVAKAFSCESRYKTSNALG